MNGFGRRFGVLQSQEDLVSVGLLLSCLARQSGGKVSGCMMMNNSGYGGLGVLLGIVLMVLKLTGVIAWSWWWILLPLYGPTLLMLIGVAIYVLILKVIDN